MENRLKHLEELHKKKIELEAARKSNELMLQGGTDSEPVTAILQDNGNATRQLYHGIGFETLQSYYSDEEAAENTELSDIQSLPHYNNEKYE